MGTNYLWPTRPILAMIMLFVRQSNNREVLSGTSSILTLVFFDFLLTVNAVPNECVIRTGQPYIGKS